MAGQKKPAHAKLNPEVRILRARRYSLNKRTDEMAGIENQDTKAAKDERYEFIDNLRRAGLSKEEQLRIFPWFFTYPDVITRAKGGDTEAARHLLACICFLLDSADQSTPLPLEIRHYLFEAFDEIVKGADANVALRVERKNRSGGRPKELSHGWKMIVGCRIESLLHKRKTLESACLDLEEEIGGDLDRYRYLGLEKVPSHKTLARIYGEVKDEVAAIHRMIEHVNSET